jgi:hypothetical protein
LKRGGHTHGVPSVGAGTADYPRGRATRGRLAAAAMGGGAREKELQDLAATGVYSTPPRTGSTTMGREEQGKGRPRSMVVGVVGGLVAVGGRR